MTTPEESLVSVEGEVERIVYESEETGFFVGRLRQEGQRELTTFVGNLMAVSPGETVRLQGSVTTTSSVVDTITAQIRVNGQVFATLEGNAQGVTFYDANGDVIQDAGAQHDVLEALDHLREAVEDTLDFIEDLFDPIENLLNG